MARQSVKGEGKSAPIGFRTSQEMRDRIEDVAKKSGRSLAEEIEARLYASFDFDLSAREGVLFLLARPETADFCDDIGKVFLDIRELSERRGFTEIETREALKAALGVLAFNYLWTGEDEPPALDGPEPAPGTRIRDLPPQPLGHEVATERALWNATWREGSVPDETADGKISNVWSGDGLTVLQPGRTKGDVPRASAGESEVETPERLRLYRPVRSYRMRGPSRD